MQLRRTAHAPTLTEQATLVECASLDDNAVPQPPPTARKRPLLSATAVSAKSPSYTSEMYQKYAMCKPKEQPTLDPSRRDPFQRFQNIFRTCQNIS